MVKQKKTESKIDGCWFIKWFLFKLLKWRFSASTEIGIAEKDTLNEILNTLQLQVPDNNFITLETRQFFFCYCCHSLLLSGVDDELFRKTNTQTKFNFDKNSLFVLFEFGFFVVFL